MATRRILIMDAAADIREATQLCLEITGHWDVLKASNGQEGIAIAQSEKPDVILLDMMMSGMDGPRNCHIPMLAIAIILSG